MVAARIRSPLPTYTAPLTSSPTSTTSKGARNLVRRVDPERPVTDGRKEGRARVACAAWLCAAHGSKRGYALDLSATGARFGGMGLGFAVGDRLIAKIVIDGTEAPLVMRAEIVRYAPSGGACPELCVRFLDNADPGHVDEHFRLARYVDSVRACAPASHPSSTLHRGP